MTDHTQTAERRLPAGYGQAIDRTTTFTFTFDGEKIAAHPGDTIASALSAAGVRILSRSFKYHRPRGLLCCAGHCPNCLVQVGDEPNVRACRRAARPGLQVRSQNAWPSLQRDLMSLTALGDRFLPVGFYYKTFIRPRALWPVYEWALRRAAGLGRVNPHTAPDTYDKQYLHADVTVVGAGPAGLSAALAAGQQGARVLLFDENPLPGGHLRYANTDWSHHRQAGDDVQSPKPIPVGPNPHPLISDLQSQLLDLPNVTVYRNTTVLGYYEDNWLSAVCDHRLFKIRAGSIVVATGAYEQPLVFGNNDLPGVMLGSAVQRLLHLYAVAPGSAAVVISANDDGWRVAADLHRAGATVRAVIDHRSQAPSVSARPIRASLEKAGIAVYEGSTILSAEGRGVVQEAIVAPIDQHGQPSSGATVRLGCDLIAISVGWVPANSLLYEAGGQIAYEPEHAEFLPCALPSGIFAAGRVTGPGSLARQLSEGRLAGREAVAYAGGTPLPAATADEEEMAVHTHPSPDARQRTSSLVRVSGPAGHNPQKRFVCFCEDVTDKDIEAAIAEGYNSIELLKRYSTISMGPCQGKMCSVNTIHLCARANGWSAAETGTTTARPPATPVPLGVLAGQKMEPVKVTPAHDWHLENGAQMMVAGLWLRPEHYGDPTAEVKAVRHRVGLIDVSTLGKLRLTGSGVPALLERLYVNRWRQLAPGRVRYGLMCNEEGIVLDDGVTARVGQNEYYMTTTSSGARAIYEWIQWWLQSGWGGSVHVTPLTEVHAAFNLAGPRSRAVLARLADGDVGNEAFPYMHVRDMEVAGVPCRLLRIGFTGELSYEIHCPAGYGRPLWEALMDAGAEEGILPFGIEAQRVLRLEKAHLIVGQDTDALSDPFGAGVGWAVKLDKSDFLGRRALQQISQQGSTQRLTGFKMVTPGVVPAEGVQIVEGDGPNSTRILGFVTSSRYSPTLQEAIGLCWLPASMVREGARFTIRLEDGQLAQATVHEGSFYDAEGKRLKT